MSRFRNEDGSIRVPHTLVIISIILVLVAIATYLVPGGIYERYISDTGRELIADGSFQYIDSSPQGVFSVLQSPIDGMVAAAQIIAFLFVVSGAFSIVAATRAIDSGIKRAVIRLKGAAILIIPIIMFMFSLGGAVFGMVEESIPFVAILVPLTIALGYDSLVAMGISYFGCVVGFTTAMFNPFNVGVAQEIAGLDYLSGAGFRTIVWLTATFIGITFIMLYGRKIKKNPELSPMYEIDQVHREESNNSELTDDFTGRQKLVLLGLAIAMTTIIWGVTTQGYYLSEIAAIFLALGLVSGILGGLSGDDMATAFIAGAKDMIGAAVMVGFSRGIVILATNGQIIDTILFTLSNLLVGVPSLIASYLMLIVQTVINFFVGSGSGQAALTMPIIAPLGDIIGISRQTSVFIFQLGDGFSNAIYPTGATLIACLGAARIPYTKWLKWIMPLQAIFFVMSLVFITIAMNMSW